jgi:hypothetical protein
MTTYTAIPNGDVDQDSPVTQTLVTLLRDNPIAISEGSTDAPRIQPRALQTGLLGRTFGNSEVFDITNIKAVRLDLAAYFNNTSSNARFQAAFSDDGGSTWGATQDVFVIADASSTKTTGSVFVEIDCETGSYQAAGVMGSDTSFRSISDSGTLTVPTNADRVRFSKSTSLGVFAGLVVAVSGRD